MADLRYDQFPAGTPSSNRIILHADPASGSLEKCTINALLEPSVYLPPMSVFAAKLSGTTTYMAGNSSPVSVSGNISLLNGIMQLQAIVLPAITVSAFCFGMDVSGGYTAANYNGLAIYAAGTTTATLVAYTANDGAIFKAASNTIQTAPLAAPVSLAGGAYYIAALHCNSAVTTAPRLNITSASCDSDVNRKFIGNDAFFTGGLSGLTALPSSITYTAVSAANNPFMFVGVF